MNFKKGTYIMGWYSSGEFRYLGVILDDNRFKILHAPNSFIKWFPIGYVLQKHDALQNTPYEILTKDEAMVEVL